VTTQTLLAESAAPPESFHDCHVHGLSWLRNEFCFSMKLNYILKWIAPSAPQTSFRFLISEASLTFHDVDELKLSLDWSESALDLEIAALTVRTSRTTPTGRPQRLFEFDLAQPNGRITLWSSSYSVLLIGEAVISDVASRRGTSYTKLRSHWNRRPW